MLRKAFLGGDNLRYLIADLVTEYTPRYDYFNLFIEKFKYNGKRSTNINLSVSQDYIDDVYKRMNEGKNFGYAESFAVGNIFFKSAIRFKTMMIHSSALVINDGAYLFAGKSGVGKSTHTKLWKRAFGDKISIINDDKPAVRVFDKDAVAYGTPFDGGSGIAENTSAPLKAIVFIERGEFNSVRIPTSDELINCLYSSTVHMLNASSAKLMLDNIDALVNSNAKFYILTCNTDISAAYTAYNAIVK